MLHHFLALVFCLSSTLIFSCDNVYHQVIPLLTKKTNVAQPSSAEQHFLTAAKVFMEYGTNHSSVSAEMIHDK